MKKLLILLALAISAATAHAQTGDWGHLQTLKHNTLLVVETDVNPYGPGTFDRCRLQVVDASTLTCTLLDRHHTRLVFPRARLDAIYRVNEHPFSPADFLKLAVVGTLVGGLIALSPEALLVGLAGLIVWGVSASISATADAWDHWNNGPPNPLPDNEKRTLIYTR